MTSGWAWPRIIGPQLHTRSTYSRPSASVSQGPWPETMKRGVPPTALKARTGEFTPPGVTTDARSNNAWETGASYGYGLPMVCLLTGSLTGTWSQIAVVSKSQPHLRHVRADH